MRGPRLRAKPLRPAHLLDRVIFCALSRCGDAPGRSLAQRHLAERRERVRRRALEPISPLRDMAARETGVHEPRDLCRRQRISRLGPQVSRIRSALPSRPLERSPHDCHETDERGIARRLQLERRLNASSRY